MKKYLIGAAVLLTLLGGGAWFTAWANTPSTPSTPIAAVEPTVQKPTPKPPTVDELLRLVNEERAKVGVAPLVLDPLLNQSAQYKAQDMVDRNYFAHTDPVTGKNNGLDYALSIGAQCPVWISENLFWAKYDKTESATDSWMNSKPHKEAMLDGRYESVGFGVHDWRVVAHFCDEY